MIQERKHRRKNILQVAKQQLPNHQLYKISHKMSLSLNNSHKMSTSLNNNHKVKPPLIPNRNMSHHNLAAMNHFQIHLPHPQRCLRRKIFNLYQRNQKYSTFNLLYVFYFIFTDPYTRKTRCNEFPIRFVDTNSIFFFSSNNQTFNNY